MAARITEAELLRVEQREYDDQAHVALAEIRTTTGAGLYTSYDRIAALVARTYADMRNATARAMEVQANTFDECARQLSTTTECIKGHRYHPLAAEWNSKAQRLREQAGQMRAKENAI